MSEGISRRHFLRWGLGTALGAVFTGRFPALAHSGEPKMVPNAGLGAPILSVNTDARFVSLTFDDLWYEYTAERIGSSYARRGIRLTFFPIGHAVRNNLERPYEGFENLYPRLRDMGHEIGCHLFTHKVIRGYSLQQLIDEEMEPALDVLQRALGKDFYPVALRPPYGIVTPQLRQLSLRYDIPLVLWDVDTRDAICSSNHQPEECEAEMLQNMQKYVRPGSIVLQHAIKASLLAIEPTLDLLAQRELEPISLTSLLTLSDRFQQGQQGGALRP